MKTTMMVMVGLLAAFTVADESAAMVPSASNDRVCEPVTIDGQMNPHVNPDCIVAESAAPAPQVILTHA